MRSFDTRVAALALDVREKWIDNLLSMHRLPGIQRGRQGVQRRVSEDGLLVIELVRLLAHELGVPLRTAAVLATRAAASPRDNVLQATTPSGLAVVFPVDSIRLRLRQRIRDAVEGAVHVRRGRPPRVPEHKTPDA